MKTMLPVSIRIWAPVVGAQHKNLAEKRAMTNRLQACGRKVHP